MPTMPLPSGAHNDKKRGHKGREQRKLARKRLRAADQSAIQTVHCASKSRYLSRISVAAAARVYRPPLGFYHCPICQAWHLTSQR